MEIQEEHNTSTNRFFIGLLIFVLTIIVVQQITNIFFPDSGQIRLMAKMVLDTAVIGSGLAIKNKLVANSVLAAGFIRYIVLFFQDWGGGSPQLKTMFFAIALIVLILVAVLKFGHFNGKEEKS